jgi:hypothetical protein
MTTYILGKYINKATAATTHMGINKNKKLHATCKVVFFLLLNTNFYLFSL